MADATPRPEDFVGSTVVILGLGNTGNDVAEELVGKASSVSVAHNHGAIVVSLPPPRPGRSNSSSCLATWKRLRAQKV
jgi:cation diffusion facilitator CzcD-associated flavoprotein CzcO